MLNNIIVYHHNDLDGIASAAIIYNIVDTGKYIPTNYGDIWNHKDVKDAVVYVVDFSFPDMYALKDACKELIWIDHHKSAMERQAQAWNDATIKGIRDLNYAGCELTWMYFNSIINMPEIIKYIGDFDMWEFTLPDTKPVTEAATYELTSHDTDMWADLFNPVLEKLHIKKLKDNGNILLKAKELRIDKAYKSGTDVIFHGFTARIVNASADVSEIGERIYQNGYNIALVWRMVDDQVVLSFRSGGDGPAVDTFAKIYGGGGHKHAAGAQLTFDDLMEIYKW